MNKDALNSRRLQIVKLLRRKQDVSVQELASTLDVTPMTIRRDFESLERMQYLVRTHGGAHASRPGLVAFAFEERRQSGSSAKEAIARQAAEHVRPGMTLSIDTGTTTLEVARAIAGLAKLKVLTSSLAIAAALYARDNIDLVLLGGNVGINSPDLYGPLTEDNLRRFRTQLAILGTDAADASGLFTTDLSVARVSQAMMDGAERTLLVTDSAKFTRTSFVRYAPWSRIHAVVTDDHTPPDARRWLEEQVAEVHYVSFPGKE